MADEQLDVSTLDPHERIEPAAFAPLEPASQLVGIQLVGMAGIPSQERYRGELCRGHRLGLERQQDRFGHDDSRRSDRRASPRTATWEAPWVEAYSNAPALAR